MRRYRVQIGDRTYVVAVGAETDGRRHVRVDDRDVEVHVTPSSPRGATLLTIDGRVHDTFTVREGDDTWAVGLAGVTYDAEVMDDALARFRRASADGAHQGQEVIRAPMPGLVVGVPAQPGARLEEGAPVVVLEAMKMQNELVTKRGGAVREVRAAVGDKVEKGAVLAVIDP